ncbi:MAG: hypothetical protein J5726_03510 [Treponema sp.]|nr:hypothetical protein [Treponema sp.]
MKKLLVTVAAILAIAMLTGCPGAPKDTDGSGSNSGNGSSAGTGNGGNGSGGGSGAGTGSSGSGGGNETPAVTQKTIKNVPDAIGDIVLKDGKAIAYYDGLTLTDAEKADAIAVIFYAGGDNELGSRKLGVGLYEYCHTRSYYAQNSNTTGRKTNDANDETNGLNNQKVMENYDDYKTQFISDFDSDHLDNLDYPAFYWTGNYYDWDGVDIPWDESNPNALCKNWYVPATKELKKLLEQSTIVNKAFAKISDTADKFTETGYKSYWSSTTDNNPTNSISPEKYENAYYFILEPQATTKVQGPYSIKKDSALAVRAVHAF